MQTLSYMGLGIVAGILSGIFGIGGGIVLVPVLVYVFHLTQHQASGVSLVALLLPVSTLGLLHYYKSGAISIGHIRTGLLIALGMFLGSYLGARLAGYLDAQVIRRGFAILLVIVASNMWFR